MNDASPESAVAKVDVDAAEAGMVTSVDRALRLMEALGSSEDGLRLTALAKATKLSVSTVHRLLATLQRRNFVHFEPQSSSWHIGQQAFTVGAAFSQKRNLVGPALPFLRRLRDQTRETANLGIVEDGKVIVLTQVESREIMRAVTRVGGLAPVAQSGMGKAILSAYSHEDVEAVVATYGLQGLTSHSVRTVSALKGQLQQFRDQGYAVDDEELVKGLRCVAAVVYNARAEPACAISISGMLARVSDARLPALGRLVAETAAGVTAAIGGVRPG